MQLAALAESTLVSRPSNDDIVKLITNKLANGKSFFDPT